MELPDALVNLISVLFPQFSSEWYKNNEKVIAIHRYITNTSRIYTICLNTAHLSEDVIKKAKLLGFNSDNEWCLCYEINNAPYNIKKRT